RARDRGAAARGDRLPRRDRGAGAAGPRRAADAGARAMARTARRHTRPADRASGLGVAPARAGCAGSGICRLRRRPRPVARTRLTTGRPVVRSMRPALPDALARFTDRRFAVASAPRPYGT